MPLLKEKLESCLRILSCGGPTYIGDTSWLNVLFCIGIFDLIPNMIDYFVCFIGFLCRVFGFFKCCAKIQKQWNGTGFFEIICLCLTQIIICIKHLEYTIQTESTSGKRIQVNNKSTVNQVVVLTNWKIRKFDNKSYFWKYIIFKIKFFKN